MRKLRYLLLSCLTLILCFSMSACELPWTKHFYDYHVVWYSGDPFIEFKGDKKAGEERLGKMTLDGTEYNICVGHAIRDVGIYFINHDTHGEFIKDDDLIWEGNAEVKDGKLIIKIEKDYVSNYAGKTLILNQRPVEEDT